MTRPYIITHMLMSIDGKVTGDFLANKFSENPINEYYKVNRKFKADAFACGRRTMQSSFTGYKKIDLTKFENVFIDDNDYIGKYKKHFFAVSFDRKGKLPWTSNIIKDEDPGYDKAHIIQVLTRKVNKAYLAYLRSIGVSYIFAGEENIDISLACQKLYQLFNIKTLLLEGGSIINGAFMKADLVDELSLFLLPFVGDKKDKSLFFTSKLTKFELFKAKTYQDGSIYLRYRR